MRALAGLAVALLLAGCLQGGSDKYFPPAGDLPDGLVPLPADSSEWRIVGPALGMQTNPGRMSALDKLPATVGHAASVEAYFLQGPNGTLDLYGILVLRYNGTADVGKALEDQAACDGKQLAYVLRDGMTYVLVSGNGGTERGKQVLDDLARVVQERSGATLVC